MKLIVVVALTLVFMSATSDSGFKCPQKVYTITPVQLEDDPELITKKLAIPATVKLQKGEYTVKDHIVFSSKSCLFGAGSMDDGTKLVVTESDNDGRYHGVIRVDKKVHVRMKGFSLDIRACKKNKFCKSCLFINSATKFWAQDVVLRGGSTDTVVVRSSARLMFDRVFLSHAKQHCMNSKNTDDIYVSHSRAYSCGYHGFTYTYGSKAVLVDSSAEEIGKGKYYGKYSRPLHGCGANFMGVKASSNNSYAARVDGFHVKNAYFAGVWGQHTSVKITQSSVSVSDKKIKPTACYRFDEDTKYYLKYDECPENLKCLRIDKMVKGSSSHKIHDDKCELK